MTGERPEILQPWQAAGFEALLRTALDEVSQGLATTFAECGCAHSRYGLRLTLPAGAEVDLQLVSARPPDERGTAQGSPPPLQRAAALPAAGKTALTAVERHLIGVLTARQDPSVR
jgi:hypothetical protein